MDYLIKHKHTHTHTRVLRLTVERIPFFLFHRNSGKLCWLASLSRDVTGKALLSSEVVEFVILWCYGFGTVLDFFGWFRCESPAGRLPGQHKRVARERRERARALARRFKLSGFGHHPQAAGPIRASVRDGAPPARLLLQGIFM